MIPYTFDMPNNTHATLVGWVSKWRAILRIPGTTLFPPAVRKAAILDLYKDYEIRAFIRDCEVALSKFEVKTRTAKLSLLHLTEEQVEGLYWCMANARTGHGRQQKLLLRLADVTHRFLKRSPLLRLAECAE